MFFHRNSFKKAHPNILNFHLNTRIAKTADKLIPLYPFQSTNIKLVFFYGKDFKRQRITTFLDNFWPLFFNWFNFFIVLFAIFLCAIRRVVKLRRDGFISSFIDVLITFIGGGDLHINDHRLEKWFFGVVYVASIFLNAIGLESTLFLSYVDSDHRIDTFDKLRHINPPFAISTTLGDRDIVEKMLRYVLLKIPLHKVIDFVDDFSLNF